MKCSYLHFFVFVTSAASQAKLRHNISSQGPDVTISLSWDPAYCPDPPYSALYRVELFKTNAELVDLKEISDTVTKFESSEKVPISFFSYYRLRIVLDCTFIMPYQDILINTGPGELRPPRGVTVIGGNQRATIRWLEPRSSLYEMEIAVCYRTSKNCTGTFRTDSSTEEYVVEPLAHGTPYTAMVSVKRASVPYRSQPVSIDFATQDEWVANIKWDKEASGPKLTLKLHWHPAPCDKNFEGAYFVDVCNSKRKCSSSVTGGAENGTIVLEHEGFDFLYWSNYTVSLRMECLTGETFSLDPFEIYTGPGELLPLNDLTITAQDHSAVVAWNLSELNEEQDAATHVVVVVCELDNVTQCLTPATIPKSQSSLNISGLVAGIRYTVEAKMYRNEGNKAYESKPFSREFETEADPPQQVGNLSVQQEECSRIVRVTWEAPDYDSSFVLNYRVSIGGDVTPTISTVVNGTSASIRVPVEPGERLLVEVRALVQSIPSIIGLPARWILDRYRILQGTPQGVLVTTLRGTKIVKWKEADPECEVLSYKVNATAVPSRKRAIYSRTRPIFELSSLQSAYSRYVLEISACTDAVGHDCGPPALVEIAAAVTGYPSRPRVELVKQDSDSVLFRWWEPTEPRGPIDGYEFAYGQAGDSFTPSNWVSVDGSERSASVKKLQVGTTYVFHVQAFNLDSKGRKLYSLSGILVVKIEEQLHTEGGGSLGVLGSSGVSSRDCRRTEYSHLSSSKQDMTFET